MNCGITCSAPVIGKACARRICYRPKCVLLGALEEIGFDSYIDRTMLKKQFAEKLRDDANLRELSQLWTYAAKLMALAAGVAKFVRCGHKLV